MARTRRGRQRNIVSSRNLIDESETEAADERATAPGERRVVRGQRVRSRTRARQRTQRAQRGVVPAAASEKRPVRRRHRRSRRLAVSEARAMLDAEQQHALDEPLDEPRAMPPALPPRGDEALDDRFDEALDRYEVADDELVDNAMYVDEDDALRAPHPTDDGLWREDDFEHAADGLDAPGDGSDGEAEAEPRGEVADEALLDRVRSALDGAQSATVQADFTLRGIGQELRAISQRQTSYESKAILNSVFAYVIFCALIFGALYFIFDLRSSKNAVDERYYETELERQTERLDLLEAELEKYRQGSHYGFEVFQLIEQARHDEALERYNAVRDRIINPAEAALLESRIDAVRWKLAESAYRDGLDFFTRDNFEQARDAFFHSLSYQSDTPYAHLLNYHLGRSLYALGDFQGARHYFETALESELPRDLESEARYLYAVATENVGMDSEAFDLYDAFLKRYRSYHEHSDDVHKRMGRIERAQQRERIAAQRAKRERQQQKEEAASD